MLEDRKKANKVWNKLFKKHAYLVCKACGWKSKSYPENTLFGSLAGEIPCPVCCKKKQNRGIETYGRVKVVIE